MSVSPSSKIQKIRPDWLLLKEKLFAFSGPGCRFKQKLPVFSSQNPKITPPHNLGAYLACAQEFNEYAQVASQLSRFDNRGIKLGLERMKELCQILEIDLEKQTKYIHIAGTNGKGTVTALCQNILTESGYRTGSCYSPYIYDLRERFMIDNKGIDLKSLRGIVHKLLEADEILEKTEHEGIREFEAKTALAFKYWQNKQCDFAVVETGLGGLLDATNVITPVVTVITSIGLDHTSMLGNTLAEIAINKAGIIKQGIPCVVGDLPQEAAQVIETTCQEKNAPLIRLGKELFFAEDKIQLNWNNKNYSWDKPRSVQHQTLLNNVALSLATTTIATSSQSRIEFIENTFLPGKFEKRQLGNKLLILDTAHNPQAINNLINQFQNNFPHSKPDVVLGMLDGHDYKESISEFQGIAQRLLITKINFPRTLDSIELAEYAQSIGLEALSFSTVDEAIKEAKADTILITGSNYLLSEVDDLFIDVRLS